jgi:hypothetical protein
MLDVLRSAKWPRLQATPVKYLGSPSIVACFFKISKNLFAFVLAS